MKIEIPTPDGECSAKCRFFLRGAIFSHCVLGMECSIQINGQTYPGPDCHPGVYELVPEGEMEASENSAKMFADINRAVAAALGQDRDETWHDLGEKVGALRAENERLRKALERIVAESPRNGEDCAYLIARAALEHGTGQDKE